MGWQRRRLRGGARPVRAGMRRLACAYPRAVAMTAPPTWREELAGALGAIGHAESIAGGDINDAWRVELADGRRIFVKTHEAPPPGMYAAEAQGLAWLAEGPLRVPRVLGVGESFLALEWLELGARSRGADFDERFG